MRKACMDCKHFRPGGSERGPWCHRFAKEFEVSWNPVYGARKNVSAPDCKVARDEGGQCGPNGRSWEPRAGTDAYDEWVREEAAKAVPDTIGNEAAPPRRRWWQWFLPAWR